MKISEETKVSTDIKSLVGIIAGVAVAVWAYFGVIERLNNLETKNQLFEQDLLEASTQKPIDQEQFMLIEDLYKTVEKMEQTQEMNMTNKVNIQFLQKQMEKALIDIERLKDSNREMKYTNGH
tara:strand:- start:719 stop:1087 length:369 start_codon:yes stop_codon:yes gene_type:complete